MEMIDVLQRLKEIAESKPELVKDAVENVSRTNPKVDESKIKRQMEDDAESMSKKEFVEKYGSAMAGFWHAYNGYEESAGGVNDMMLNLKMHFKSQNKYKNIDDFEASPEWEQISQKLARKESAVREAAKPDFLDMDKDGDKKEPMKKAINDKEMKKESVNEAIQISTDSPQEASMMMQILKLAGVQPVDAAMIGAEEPTSEPEMDQDDAAGSMDMARIRDIIKKPEEEQAEETFANEPEEKVQDIDTLVNVHSGGLNRNKKTYPKVANGDNPMAAEDKITEEELANSLRTQYESFKEAYQNEAKKAKSPYAVGMAQAMKSTGDKPPLEKSTIKKAHDIAKSVEKSQK